MRGSEEDAGRAEESSTHKVGQHSGILRDTCLFRNKMSEKVLLRSILKGKGIGERKASSTLQGMDHLGLVQVQHEDGGV